MIGVAENAETATAWFDAERGVLDKWVFVDEEVYRVEQERVFGLTWQYLCHVSQIREVNDYVTGFMGEDPVITVRDNEGQIRSFLNSCRHRGAKVCLTDRGNARVFQCKYHNWAYANSGELVGVPLFDSAYFRELDKSQWGLIPVPRVEVAHGLVFGCWDAQAPSLREYLGEMDHYLELMLDRTPGGVEVVAGVQRSTSPANWKLLSENSVGDMYHLAYTHASAIDIGLRSRPKGEGFLICTSNGHGFGSELGGTMQGSAAVNAYTDFVKETKDRIAQTHGEDYRKIVPIGVGNVFPNLSIMDTMRFRVLRLRLPRGPHVTETWAWCLVDADLPEEIKQGARRAFILSFGPSGLLEQDDHENFAGIQENLRGPRGRRGVFNYQLGLGHSGKASDLVVSGLPGLASERYQSEENHRNFYATWSRLMSSPAPEFVTTV